MFKSNKYSKWYHSIIKTASTRMLSGYIERHHIVPKALGGNNDTNNIVSLTAKEHFICHRLLIKMVHELDHIIKMKHAVSMFMQCSDSQQRVFTARQYEFMRQCVSDARMGSKHTDDTKRKMSIKAKGRTPWNKGKKMKPISREHKQALSAFHTGKTLSKEHKSNISNSKIGHTNGMTGKKHSESTKHKMSENMKGKRGPQARTPNCPHCSKTQVTARHIRLHEADG